MGDTETRNTLVFAINGERFELSSPDHSITLLQFLRSRTRFKGTKLSCGEGGCGVCVVLVSRFDPASNRVDDAAVSSCLTLLCSVNGCSVTTTEGLGSSRGGFHAIHQRFAGFHASQCGFCTPGMCVSLYSALVGAAKAPHCPDPPSGFSKLTASEAVRAISGNLCRCTGYRSIADACKSFACDVDMEDLGFNSFWNKGESNAAMVSKLPYYDYKNDVCTFPDFLKKESRPTIALLLDARERRWHSPVAVEELQSLVRNHGSRMKLVVGNTGAGYYKEVESYDRYIDLRFIPELSMISSDPTTGIEIGAAVTISKAILALREARDGEFEPESGMLFNKIADHMEKIASVFIRNSGSIGGNLMMAQRNHFPSDIATVLLPVGAVVSIFTGHKREKLTVEEFLERPPMDSRSVLLSVKIPKWEPVKVETKTKLLFETYRAAPRPLGNALPYLNAAFLAELSAGEASDGIYIYHVQLGFGAYGTAHAIRARKVEKFLVGKILSAGVLLEATELTKAIVVPEKGISNPAYRSSLAVGFLFQFFGPLIDATVESGLRDISRKWDVLSSAKQVMEFSREYYPVGKPIMKSGAALQASGEAVFVDDIPSPLYCLHGAFICGTKPLAVVKSIKFKSDSLPKGVVSIVSFNDIPIGGENIGSQSIFGTEKLFADDLTECAGQRLALVVADTQKHADMAADMAEVEYDMENIEQPILTVEKAYERSSFFEVPSMFYPKQVGDFSKGMAEAEHKILSAELSIGSQYYFYMETQTALAVPDEDNCMVVYSSCQCPEYAHRTIARCLGIHESNVRVVTRRVGGGFGGKALKAIPAATACALAAHKLHCPVRTYLNRKTDMVTAGGRHPMKVTYSVGFKSNGKITALRLDVLINAGRFVDTSPMMPRNMMGALRKYNWGSLSFDMKVCKTNNPSRSAMRGPGEVQGTFISEAVIEHVAATLSMEVNSVREINLHTYDSLCFFYGGSAGELNEYTLPSLWDKLALSSSLDQRIEEIEHFNNCNKWRKKGISRVPIVHEVSLRPTPGKVSILSDGSIAVEVGGIELGQGLWTKVRQMAAFALGLIQCDGTGNLLEKVRIIQTDTLSLIQGGFTAGSTTSESSCEAIRLCCNNLVERLIPLKESLLQKMGSIKWEMLIQQAYMAALNLSASAYYVPAFTSMEYLNYGAAVSEVEVNLLTGATTISRVDIIYDSGQSLNPAVDLGQIEGAFVQGIGFFLLEEYSENSEGLVIANGTWSYKIPTIDTIPKQFNVEVLNSGHHKDRVLSSKASGEPPLLLAVSVHCAIRAAIREARKQLHGTSENGSSSSFQLEVPATMPVVKKLCGLETVERYLSQMVPSRSYTRGP